MSSYPRRRNGSTPSSASATRASTRSPDRSRDHDATILERLPQRLDGVAAEFRELVEEQDPVVPQYS
jgi:hypothetical protein